MSRKSLLVAVLALGLASVPQLPASAAATVGNPGFESGAGQSPAGWSEGGEQTGASYSEAGGHSGSYRLAHWASGAYQVETYQALTGLTNGPYALRVWVKSSGGQRTAYLALKNCGGGEQRTALPTASAWVQLSVSTTVSSGACTISFYSDANAGNWANFDDVTFTPTGATAAVQIKGADVSSLKKNEDHGAVYRTSSGTQQDALAILRASGVNYARLKVWVNPADGYNTKARVRPWRPGSRRKG
jgi:arabinogalactan endo-1,4-beta-galactosidase